jgi:hypothetical protein
VLAAIATAALTRFPVPFSGEAPPIGLGLAESERPGEAFGALAGTLAAHPGPAVETVVFAAAALAAPLALGRGLWGVAVWASAFLAAAVFAPPATVDVLPLALGVWAAAAVLAAPLLRRRG